jgi:hypothetical protein
MSSGTPRKLTLDGVSYDVAADTNITLNLSPFETEGVASSGRTMMKRTKRTQTAEGIPILASPTEQDQLRVLAERLDVFPMAVTLADGAVWRTTGNINFESAETEENRATIMIIPDRSPDGWALFA